jgi:NAD(P)-dependent dehydrogenase (short-subunit alcohol dehydrogenase family)
LGRLDGKVAIVTGGSAGIGQGIAVAFAKEGAEVVIAARGVEQAEKAVDMIRAGGGKAEFVKTDVTKPDDIENMVKFAVKTYGKLNILVNNAGFMDVATIANFSLETFTKIMETNVRGHLLGIKYATPELIKAGGGSIINISSLCANVAQRGIPLYAASKAAVHAITMVAAVELAPYKIRVNSLKPGPTLTPLTQSALDNDPGLAEQWKAASPLGEFIPIAEVAAAAVFFASDETANITGQGLVLDGGAEINSHFHMA